MKKTETRLPVQRPTVASRALPSSCPARAKKPDHQSQHPVLVISRRVRFKGSLPSTMGSRKGVHKLAERSSDSMAYIVSQSFELSFSLKGDLHVRYRGRSWAGPARASNKPF